MNGKQRCLNLINGKPVDRTPVFPLIVQKIKDIDS
jgi:hypothetical protein